jgi:hypothetical protein
VRTERLVNFGHALLAVLAGNAAYFALMPYLPGWARHVPFQLDGGAVVDFLACLAVFGLVKAASRWKSGPQG